MNLFEYYNIKTLDKVIEKILNHPMKTFIAFSHIFLWKEGAVILHFRVVTKEICENAKWPITASIHFS
jgi:hypothetical protein